MKYHQQIDRDFYKKPLKIYGSNAKKVLPF
jgi:hypothetical protein